MSLSQAELNYNTVITVPLLHTVGEFCVTVGPVTSTVGILTKLVKGASC